MTALAAQVRDFVGLLRAGVRVVLVACPAGVPVPSWADEWVRVEGGPYSATDKDQVWYDVLNRSGTDMTFGSADRAPICIDLKDSKTKELHAAARRRGPVLSACAR